MDEGKYRDLESLSLLAGNAHWKTFVAQVELRIRALYEALSVVDPTNTVELAHLQGNIQSFKTMLKMVEDAPAHFERATEKKKAELAGKKR